MRTANDIAEWIVRYSADDLGAPVDPLSLEKLIYYAQAFFLAIRDEPLFPDEVHAWKLGPVVPDVYKRYQRYGAEPIVVPDDWVGAPEVGNAVADYLIQVVGFFCQHTAINLSRATHLEEPWKDAIAAGEGLIRQVDMKFYYRSLMNEGEGALSRHEMLDAIPDPRWSSYYVAGICVRKMTNHPFYDGAQAKKLAEAVPPRPPYPKGFFEPVERRDFVEFDRGDDPDEIIQRVLSNG
jgi:uncharacterized phage-associated protein